MARIRSAKPDFWTDPKICALPRLVRWTFKGLWEVCADDAGRFLADARVIKGQIWPLDDDVSAKKINDYLLLLAERGRIRLYEVDGVRYGIVVHFLRHQKISHPTPSRLPEPPESHDDDAGNGSRIPPERPRNDSGGVPERFRPERDVERDVDFDLERSGSGSGGDRSAATRENRANGAAPAPTAAPSRSREENRPHEEHPLPAAAIELLALLSAEKWPDGERQLRAALSDPEGAKIRRGAYARAQNAEHLAHACRHVLKKLPRDRDLVVLWVLNKLAEPWVPTDGHGRTVTEAAAHNARVTAQDDERDQRQRLADAEEWVASHADEWAVIEARIAAEYPGHETDPMKGYGLRFALTSAKIEAAELAAAHEGSGVLGASKSGGAHGA